MKTLFRETIREYKFENAVIRLNMVIDSMPNLFGKASDKRYHIEVYEADGTPTRQGLYNYKRKADAIKAFNRVKKNGSLD